MSVRLLKLAREIALSNFREPRLPFKLTFILTYHCQLRCNMCRIWERKPTGELTAGEIRRFLRNTPHFSWINVSGGEIFLRPDIDEVFAALVEECPNLYLLDFPTHGQQTSRIVESVGRLVATPVPRILVTVSLDGPPALHDRIRGVSGSWAKAVETFSRLRSIRRRGFRPFLGMTLQAMNLDAVDQMLAATRRVIPDLNPREIHVNLAHASSHYYGKHGFRPPDPRAAGEAMRRLRKLRGAWLHPVAWLEDRYRKLAAGYLAGGVTPLPCHALSSSVFVDSQGNVMPCSIYDRKIGNLREHDHHLGKLLGAAGVDGLRRDIRRGRCPHCWTPCEAYQTILANLVPRPRQRRAVEPPPLPCHAPAPGGGGKS